MIRPCRPMQGTNQLVRKCIPVSVAQPVATPLATNSQLFGVTFSSCHDALWQSNGTRSHQVTIFVTPSVRRQISDTTPCEVAFSSCPDVLRQASGRCPHVVTIFVTTSGQEAGKRHAPSRDDNFRHLQRSRNRPTTPHPVKRQFSSHHDALDRQAARTPWGDIFRHPTPNISRWSPTPLHLPLHPTPNALPRHLPTHPCRTDPPHVMARCATLWPWNCVSWIIPWFLTNSPCCDRRTPPARCFASSSRSL